MPKRLGEEGRSLSKRKAALDGFEVECSRNRKSQDVVIEEEGHEAVQDTVNLSMERKTLVQHAQSLLLLKSSRKCGRGLKARHQEPCGQRGGHVVVRTYQFPPLRPVLRPHVLLFEDVFTRVQQGIKPANGFHRFCRERICDRGRIRIAVIVATRRRLREGQPDVRHFSSACTDEGRRRRRRRRQAAATTTTTTTRCW